MQLNFFDRPQITFSGVAGEDAPDPSDKNLPWILDSAGRPVPIQPDQASPRVVMGSTYAFHAAAVLAQMREGYAPVSPE